MNIVLPTASDIRAARAYLSWKQLNLAHECDVNINTIIAIETEKSKPTKELLETIAKVFMQEGIRFSPNGGFLVDKNFVSVFEGKDAYSKAQKDMLTTCSVNKDEILFLGVDDKKSGSEVLKNEGLLYKNGIPCRYIISSRDNYILGPLDEYRQVDPSYFFSHDVVVIYSTKIVLTSEREGEEGYKVVLINDKGIANQMRGYFNYLWNNGKKVTRTTAEKTLFKREKNEK
ncbi:hypothetical protein ACFL0U_04620 [Pseudomonadota bacterium]